MKSKKWTITLFFYYVEIIIETGIRIFLRRNIALCIKKRQTGNFLIIYLHIYKFGGHCKYVGLFVLYRLVKY